MRQENKRVISRRWGVVSNAYKIEMIQIPYLLKEWYTGQSMSSQEILDKLHKETGIRITVRSIQRLIKQHTIVRTQKEAFNIAIKKGRVKWAYKEFKYKRTKLNPKLRYQILKRDDFTCVKCGNRPPDCILEVDHIKKVSKGGTNTANNLRTLCHECNVGNI